MRLWSLLVMPMLACSFEPGALTSDAQTSADDASRDAAIDSAVDAPIDAAPPSNLVALANGGVLDSFTSEYCAPGNSPGDCQPGYWLHTNIHDGAYAMGLNSTSRSAGWCSARKFTQAPEEFVFSFAGGKSAAVERVVIQNWGENAGYYSTHVIVYGQAPNSTVWSVLVDSALATSEPPQSFPLQSSVVLAKIRFSLTDGQDGSYWELGEVEAWGRLQ